MTKGVQHQNHSTRLKCDADLIHRPLTSRGWQTLKVSSGRESGGWDPIVGAFKSWLHHRNSASCKRGRAAALSEAAPRPGPGRSLSCLEPLWSLDGSGLQCDTYHPL